MIIVIAIILYGLALLLFFAFTFLCLSYLFFQVYSILEYVWFNIKRNS